MSDAIGSSPRRGRLDERVLGAGTGLRFALLVVLFLSSSATVVSQIVSSFTDPHNIGVGCALAAGADPNSDYLSLGLATVRSDEAYRACVSRFVPAASPWLPLYVIAVLVLAAGVLYWALPSWKGRRSQVVPIETIDTDGELRSALDELVDIAGLARTPRFVVAPAAATASAVVFGRWRRYAVCLHGGLVARRHQDPEGFRAVVLHELAHIRNRDIDVTYATVALWRVFLVTVLPAYLIWAALHVHESLSSEIFGPSERSVTGRNAVLTATTITFVYLARADILRTREFYADLDALRWGAEARSWRRGTDRGAAREGRIGKALTAFAGLWRTHPTWEQRRTALTDPKDLFRPQTLTLFVTGATAAIAASQLSALLYGGWVRVLSALVAGLIAAIPGVALWRAVARAVLLGERVSTGLRVGCWLGVGLACGELLTGSMSGLQWLPTHPEVYVLLVVISAGIMCWTAQIAELSIRSWPGRTLRFALLTGLVATWLIFGLWYAWWQTEGHVFATGWVYSQAAIRQGLEQDFGIAASAHPGVLSAIAAVMPVVLPIGTDPLVMWAAAALWLLPLLGWARRPVTGAPEWARQALPGGLVPELRAGRLPSPRRVLLAAGIGAVAAWTGVAAVMAWMHSWQPSAGQPSMAHLFIFLAALSAALVTATVAAAATAGAAAARLPLLVALVAAGSAALAGLAGVFLLTSADGCLGPLNPFRSTCHWSPGALWPMISNLLVPLVLGLGIFVSAFAALLGMAARRTLRTLLHTLDKPAGRVREDAPQRPRRPIRALIWRIGAITVCLTVMALTTAVSVPYDDPEPGTHTSLTRQKLVPVEAIDAPSSPEVLAAQTDAWLRLGGRSLMARSTKSLLDIITALEDDRAFTDRGFAARRIRPHCLELERVARQSQAYFPVPDPDLQQPWSSLLNRAVRTGADCRRAIDDGKLRRYKTAMRAIIAIAETQHAMSGRILAEAAGT